MKEFDKSLLDIGWKNLESQEKKYTELDTKAMGIISISGIIITFITKPATDSSCFSISLYILTSLAFFTTILFSIWAIRTRKYKGLLTNNLIYELGTEPEERQIGGIIGSIAQTQENLYETTRRKVIDIRHTVYIFGISILLLIIYSLSNII